MENKKIHILISVTFGIIIILLLIVASIILSIKSSNNIITKINNIEESKNIELLETNDITIKETDDSLKNKKNIDYFNNICITNLSNLTDSQYQNKEKLYKLLFNTYKNITIINIISSNKNCVYINIKFNDDSNNDFIVVFDNNTFTKCYTLDLWNYYHSDANKG